MGFLLLKVLSLIEQLLKEKYRPIGNIDAARDMWELEYAQGSKPGEGGRPPLRYLQHHLLCGSVLAVWSQVEAVFARQVPAAIVRVARVALSQAQSPAALQDAPRSPTTALITSPSNCTRQSPRALPVSPAPAQSGGVPALAAAAAPGLRNLVGIWIPGNRVEEVLSELKDRREGVKKESAKKPYQRGWAGVFG